jgi:hypothetical protein
MNFSQAMAHMFNSVTIRVLLIIAGFALLLHTWKDKMAAIQQAHKTRRTMRKIEKQMWWIQ